MSLDSGFRAIGQVHDVDRHGVAVDFLTDGRTPDAYRTAWSPHCFQDSFRSHPHPEMVLDHKTGSANVIGETLRAESLPDRARLVGRFEDFARKPAARQAYQGILDGTYPGFSFYYTGAQHRPLEGVRGAVRYVRARLEDWGPVRQPAIKGQRLVSIRSAPAATARVEAARVLRDRFGVDRAAERDRDMWRDYRRRQQVYDGLSRVYNLEARRNRRAMADLEEAIELIEEIERSS